MLTIVPLNYVIFGYCSPPPLISIQNKFLQPSPKAGQTEFAVYRHRPHGFSEFPKFFRFQIQYSKYTGLGRTLSSALISGRGSGDLELEHIAILVSLIV